MSLRQLAENDLSFTLEDSVTGFGWPVTLTDPDGFTGSANLTGQAHDISQIIDPDTGTAISGRQTAFVLRMASITAAGFTSQPVGEADSASKPWLVTFDSINGLPYTFKVEYSDPDNVLGTISLMLGAWIA
jgi:hypothetical protein